MIKLVFLSTDLALLTLFISLISYVAYVRHTPPLATQWARVFEQPVGMACAVVLTAFMLLTLIDSVHYRSALPTASNGVQAYSPNTLSLLDVALEHMKAGQEKTYSRPLHSTQIVKETSLIHANEDAQEHSIRDNPPLKFGGAHLRQIGQRGEITDVILWLDVAKRSIKGLLLGAGIAGALILLWLAVLLAGRNLRFKPIEIDFLFKNSRLPWRVGFITLTILCILSNILWQISLGWHVLGTDRAGNDMLYLALKSVRTALAIGFIATLSSLPFAIILGIAAGTLRGWVDTVIQYIYTVLSSIPGVLLIAACVLMIQSYVDTHPNSFPTALERADVKLFLLCTVLGLTSWAGLARLLRAEAMKLREMDFVLAARSFGVSNWRIMLQHIVPNTLHLLILSVTMEFSGLVLYEAVLSYIGIGVDPAIQSFGGMVNGARSELARNPIIWWPLFSAFSFMLALVLTANLFTDCVRDAFDPKYAVNTL